MKPPIVVCILNYGSGNVQSVYNLLRQLTPDVCITNAATDIQRATHLILPGVGAFRAAIDRIRSTLPLDLIEQRLQLERIPMLGICVGLQVMADVGQEFGTHSGLGWIPGTVSLLQVGELPLPHIGWNNLVQVGEHPLMRGFSTTHDFYYVHSYAYTSGTEARYVLAECDYGQRFPVVLAKGNVMGVQFHPEKSQRAGRQLLENFLALRPEHFT